MYAIAIIGDGDDVTIPSIYELSPMQNQYLFLLQVELKVHSIRCVSRADNLPFELADAMRSEEDLQREDAQFATVTQDTRLENRWIDLRTPVNHAIFKIQSAVCQVCSPCLRAGLHRIFH